MGRTHARGRGRSGGGGPPKPQIGTIVKTPKKSNKSGTMSLLSRPASSTSLPQIVQPPKEPSSPPEPERPVPPNFRILPYSTSDKEVEDFWDTYKRVVNTFNINTIHFQRKYLTFKRWVKHGEENALDNERNRPIDISECMNDTSWIRRGVEQLRTCYETNKFVIKRSTHPPAEWYKSTHLDLSGPLGTLMYRESSAGEAADFFQVDYDNISTPFKFNAIRFNLTIFNYLERCRELKGVISTGFRITFPKAGKEVADGTFKIQVSSPESPATNKTRIIVELAYDSDCLRRHIEFIVDGSITEERVNSYPLKVTESEGCDFVIDIPMRTQVLKRSITKSTVDGKVVKKTVISKLIVSRDLVLSSIEETVTPESEAESEAEAEAADPESTFNDLPYFSDYSECPSLPDIEPLPLN